MMKAYKSKHVIKQKVRTRKQIMRNRYIVEVISRIFFVLGLILTFITSGFNMDVPNSTVFICLAIAIAMLLIALAGILLLERTER